VAVLHQHRKRIVLEEDHQEVEDPWDDHPSENPANLLANVADLERIPFPRRNIHTLIKVIVENPVLRLNFPSMMMMKKSER
jgi:hypothetical protein